MADIEEYFGMTGSAAQKAAMNCDCAGNCNVVSGYEDSIDDNDVDKELWKIKDSRGQMEALARKMNEKNGKKFIEIPF